MSTTRTIERTFPAVRTTEGGGFIVHRPFPTRLLMDFDPFLLLDEMGPIDYAPGEAKGAPDHPHRGFETVTYALEGQFGHKDSAGHSGTLRAGDVQWMTAGAGVVHGKVRVKVIAGEALGVKAAIETRTPILYQHFSLQPGATIQQPVPADYRVFAYSLSGKGFYGEGDARQEIDARKMIVFQNDGESVTLTAGAEPLEVLLLGGVPLKEPVVRYGPFVMNTEDEIRQAVTDYQAGRMGAITH